MITYFDSLQGKNNNLLQTLFKYVQAEHKTKKSSPAALNFFVCKPGFFVHCQKITRPKKRNHLENRNYQQFKNFQNAI